jgi:hypothetical protein
MSLLAYLGADDWNAVDMSDDEYISASQAKYSFFLTPSDLAELPSLRVVTAVCGNTKMFHRHHVQALALRKFGLLGFQKKKLARAKREAKKRSREDDAKQFVSTIFGNPSSSDSTERFGAKNLKRDPWMPVESSNLPQSNSVGRPRLPKSVWSVEEWKEYGRSYSARLPASATCAPQRL